MKMIGLTGVTGEVGSLTLSFLPLNANLCLLVRDCAKVKDHLSANIQARCFDLCRIDSNVFDGIKTLLWILPNNQHDIQCNEQDWLKIARSAGVRHIVKLSVMRAEIDDIFHHRASELAIINSGIDYTFLRPNTFIQNFHHYELEDIKLKHQLRFPAGDGKTSFIDTRDIAEVAASILRDPNSHINQAYTLTGSEALTYGQVAELLSDELETNIDYVDTTESQLPLDRYKIQHRFYSALKRGEFAAVTPCAEQLLGKPARTLAQYFKDYKHDLC